MDWALAIERNRVALSGIIALLFSMLERAGAGFGARIPRLHHAAIVSVLRPAESAVRRLIVIAARGLAAKPVQVSPMPKGLALAGGGQRLSFPLFDPRKRFDSERRRSATGAVPRIHFFGGDPRVAALRASANPAADVPSAEDGRIDSRRLALRLAAVKRALDELPGQARRLVRLQARRERRPSAKFTSPLRPGPPPGHRKVPVHEVDRVLIDCHGLAFDALKPDTS
jgi:hypothetical protein